MPRVFSAVIEADTRFNVHPSLLGNDVAGKIGFLESCVRQADQCFAGIDSAGGAPSAGDLQILAAPEYFFGLPTGQDPFPVLAYNDLSSDAIDAGCQRISGMFPDMLIVPGTILFKQFVGRRARAQLAQDMLQAKAKFAAKNELGGDDSEAVRMRAELDAGIQAVELKGRGLVHSVKKKLGMASGKWIGFNQARVYHGGNRILTVNKMDNVNEFAEEPGDKPIQIRGFDTGSFLYPGTTVTLGLEICADHGRLRAAGTSVDIQILVSAKIAFAKNNLKSTRLVIEAAAESKLDTNPQGATVVSGGALPGGKARATAITSSSTKVGDVRCQVHSLG